MCCGFFQSKFERAKIVFAGGTGIEEQSRSKFLNFDLCSNGLQALLVEQVPGLLEKLFGRIFLRLPISVRNVSS